MSTVDVVPKLFLQIAVILIVCRMVGVLGRYLGQTQAVCDMVAGIALGPSLLGVLSSPFQEWLFPQHAVASGGSVAHPSMSILYGLSQLGLVLYMFLVGLDFNTSLFRGRLRSVGLVSLAGIAVPFALGAGAALALVNERALFPAGIGSWHAALFIGASMSITAFPMLARILHEKGVSGTRVGTMALAAGSLDDVIAWCLLAITLATLRAEPSIAIVAIVGGVAYTLGMLGIGRPLFRVFARWTDRDNGLTSITLLTVLVVLMLSAAFTEAIGIHAVFGAFIAGTALPRGRFAAEMRGHTEQLITTLLLPLFFVYSGLNTRLALVNTPWLWEVTALVIILAVAGKGIACTAAARLAGEGWRESAAIGTLMNARGLVELIMLNIGLQAGVIQPTLFTIMVMMAVVTTLMASPLFNLFYGRTLDNHAASTPLRAVLATK
ncbi:MAG: cation:proton antiporter [Vicinamibacterales bacterium]